MSVPPNLSSAPRSAGASAGEQNAGASRTVWIYVWIGIGTAMFFYLHLFHFPSVPIFHGGNQALFLDHAEHMLHGEVLYRDLFQFNLPGTEYLYYILFRCLGVHLWIGAFALLLAYSTIALLIFFFVAHGFMWLCRTAPCHCFSGYLPAHLNRRDSPLV